MNKRTSAVPLVLALALFVSSTAVFAEGAKTNGAGTAPEVKVTSEKATTHTSSKLKKDMDKLVNDAKAGKVAPRPQQFPQTSRSNLSKTTKIALLVTAIGTTIFLAILFHDLSKD
jgi:preprotein translocase subunit SecF